MIRRGFEKIKNGKYENWVFLQFLILVTVPLLIMGLLSCHIYISGENRKNELTLQSYAESVMTEYENVFSSIRQYYMDAVSGESYRWLLSQTEPPYKSHQEVAQAQTLFEGNYFMEKYISMYNFINVREKWILNNYGMFPYEDLKNKMEVDAFLEAQKGIPLNVYWQNRLDAASPYGGSAKVSNTLDSSGEQLLIKLETSSSGIISMLMVQINPAELSLLSEKFVTIGYHITVLCDKKVLTETNPNLTEAYFENGEPVSGKITDANGVVYNIIEKQSVANNMTYIIGFDTRLNKKGAFIFFLAALAVLAVFAVLLVILRLLAAAFSKPTLMLQKFVEDQNLQIREQFIRDLARGGISDEKMAEVLEKYEVFPFQSYRLLTVICKGEKEAEERNLQIAEIMKGMPDCIRELTFVTPAVLDHVMLFVIGAESDFEADNRTALAYKQIKDYIADSFGSKIASGISQPFHKLSHARRAYNECAEVLHNRSNKYDENNSSLVLYDDYSISDFTRNAYDIIMENELINSIESCKESEAKRLLELILERMEKKGVVGIERSFYLTRLLTAILVLPTKAGLSVGEVFEHEQYNPINHVGQLYNLQELIAYLEERVIHPIIICLDKEKQSGISDISKQTMKLIKDSRGMISLNECADIMNYHPNYLSKLLIKEKGMSFTDMVNAEKIKLAKFMLLTTERSVAEISEQLQYNNVQNFIRFFKNQEGITPSVFRKEHKH